MQLIEHHIKPGKKVFFASDLHLGTPSHEASRKREDKFVEWLCFIEQEAEALFLVGDIFDYWFEYKHYVPRGYVRLLGKLAQMSDKGCKIYAFTGNHDLWMKDYFQEELSIPVFHEPIHLQLNHKKFFVGHGDGLGPGDYSYKLLKKVFTNPVCKFLYSQLHPDFSARLATYFSRSSRKSQENKGEDVFQGKEQEWLYLYALKKLETKHFDYFVFGHRHLPLNIDIEYQSDALAKAQTKNEASEKASKYINLGDWINHFTYAKFDGEQLTLEYFR